MINPPSFNAFDLECFFTTPPRFQKPVKPDRVFIEEISRIDAQEIELIAIAIIDQILLNLGSDAKLRIDHTLIQKIEPGGNSADMLEYLMGRQLGKLAQQKNGNSPFVSPKESKQFMDELLWPLRQTITNAFSDPINFLMWGLHLQLSNYEPTEILETAAKKMNIKINPNQIPFRYHMVLCLNKELSALPLPLVFSLVHTSESIEFSKINFTTEEVKQGFISFFETT